MTAEQKAKALVQQFIPLANKGDSKYNLPQCKEQKKNAKQCALICVDEMDYVIDHLGGLKRSVKAIRKEYHNNIRTAIENLK